MTKICLQFVGMTLTFLQGQWSKVFKKLEFLPIFEQLNFFMQICLYILTVFTYFLYSTAWILTISMIVNPRSKSHYRLKVCLLAHFSQLWLAIKPANINFSANELFLLHKYIWDHFSINREQYIYYGHRMVKHLKKYKFC